MLHGHGFLQQSTALSAFAPLRGKLRSDPGVAEKFTQSFYPDDDFMASGEAPPAATMDLAQRPANTQYYFPASSEK